MVNLEQLRVRGLRAYEQGRVRTAARIGLLVIPMAALCLVEATGRQACACLAVLLLALAVWLRWRDRRGMEAVTTGLLAGTIPLVVGLILARLDIDCHAPGTQTLCAALSASLGLAAGVFIALREARRKARSGSWLVAGSIAVLAASMGCLRLGIASVISVALGLAVGAALAAARAAR
jgi:hypothetical protein